MISLFAVSTASLMSTFYGTLVTDEGTYPVLLSESLARDIVFSVSSASCRFLILSSHFNLYLSFE